jgi:hypothetical protein
MNRFVRIGALCAMFFSILGVAISASASQSLSPDAVLAGASNYDGQMIAITGTVRNVHTHTTPRGTFSRYDLCSTQCVHVLDRSGASVSEGSSVTVNGTFHAQLQRPSAGMGQGGWHGGQSGEGHSGGWQSHRGDFPTTDVLVVQPPDATP